MQAGCHASDRRIADKKLYNSVGVNAMLKTYRLGQESKKFLAVG